MDEIIIAGVVLNVLSLEDSVRDFEIIREQLIDAGYHLNISRVDKEKEFESSIRGNQYDIILADFKLPGFDAFGALRLCNEICPEVPFICVSGSIGEETAIELIKLGAIDYVLKDRLARLPSAIKRALDEAKKKEAKLMAEEALRKTEQQTRTFLDATLDMAFLKDASFRHIIANQALCKFYGKTASEVIGKTDFDLMDEKAAAECRKTDEQTLHSNDLHISEEVVGDRFYETRKFPVELAQGKKGVGAYIRDITERKCAEELLRESEDSFRHVFESANVGKSITTPAGKITVNQAFADLLGYSRQELEGKSWQELTLPEDIETTVTNIGLLLSGEQNSTRFNKRFLHKNGSVVWVDISSALRRDKAGQPLHFVTTLVDITERKETEELLWLKNIVFDTSIAANSIADIDGIITEANDAFLQIWGYASKDEVVGNSISHFLNDPGEAAAIVNALKGKGEWQGEYTAKKKNGSTFIAHSIATAIRDKNGKVTGYQSSVMDITEHKLAEEVINKLNENLEQRVKERTAELNKNIALLEETNKAFVGRELRMIELKERIAELEKKKI